jgi:hypothetical protein
MAKTRVALAAKPQGGISEAKKKEIAHWAVMTYKLTNGWAEEIDPSMTRTQPVARDLDRINMLTRGIYFELTGKSVWTVTE